MNLCYSDLNKKQVVEKSFVLTMRDITFVDKNKAEASNNRIQ